MAFIQYLKFDNTALPLPDSYDMDLSDVEADSGGKTEAGTVQRDVVRAGVVTIGVSFSVSPAWLKRLTAYSKQPKIAVQYFDTEDLVLKKRRCISQATRRSYTRIPHTRGCGRCHLH